MVYWAILKKRGPDRAWVNAVVLLGFGWVFVRQFQTWPVMYEIHQNPEVPRWWWWQFVASTAVAVVVSLYAMREAGQRLWRLFEAKRADGR